MNGPLAIQTVAYAGTTWRFFLPRTRNSPMISITAFTGFRCSGLLTTSRPYSLNLNKGAFSLLMTCGHMHTAERNLHSSILMDIIYALQKQLPSEGLTKCKRLRALRVRIDTRQEDHFMASYALPDFYYQ